MIQQPTLPVQQSAVQQQLQQNQVPVFPVAPPPEFNAIKINITGANVSAPSQATSQLPAAVPQQDQKINYLA